MSGARHRCSARRLASRRGGRKGKFPRWQAEHIARRQPPLVGPQDGRGIAGVAGVEFLSTEAVGREVQVSGGVTFEGLVESIADGRAKSRRDQMENAANEEHRADENGTGKRDRHPRPEQKDARSPEP